MKYKIIEPKVPFNVGMLLFEDNYLMSIFTKRDEERAKLKAGKDFKGFGWEK